MVSKCNHSEHELSPSDVAIIFDVNYRTILRWLGLPILETNNTTIYSGGRFPNAYKCDMCGRIFIPSNDVDKLIQEMATLIKS